METEAGGAVQGEIASPFPAAFVARMGELLGSELDPFLAALADPPAGLRVNTLRLSPERFRALSPFELAPLAYLVEGFLLAGDVRAGKHPYHAAGLYYLQDPAAMAVAALLDPQPGERILDLAAAPGGKATHIAARLGGEGLLVANDVHPGRARELAGNLERCGVRNAVVTAESAERLAERFTGWFDRVLLDAPCSGEAMFHKSEAAREEWSAAAVEGCARRQRELLPLAARMVRPGGLLLYSTCTFSPEEDEAVIARFLRDEAGVFELVELADIPGALPGRAEWVASELAHPELSRTRRLWPHRVPGAGHFIAALRRTTGAEGRLQRPRPGREAGVPSAVRQLLDAFRREQLAGDAAFGEGALVLQGSELYQLPEGAPPLDGLRVLRSGLWIGTVEKNRLEPSHSLALALAPDAVQRSLALPADGAEVRAYLGGHTLQHAGEKGWVLVTVDSFPLGWGKRVGTTVKNHYPKGLLWR